MRRLFQQLLDARLDLGLSSVTTDGDTLVVSERTAPVHIIFALLFLLPALFFALWAWHAGWVGALLSVLVLPLLLAPAALFGFVRGSRVLDRKRRVVRRTLSALSWSTADEQPLPSSPVVVDARWSSSGSGGTRVWTVQVGAAPGFTFVTYSGHPQARAFAEQVAAFASLELRDVVPEEHRVTRRR